MHISRESLCISHHIQLFTQLPSRDKEREVRSKIIYFSIFASRCSPLKIISAATVSPDLRCAAAFPLYIYKPCNFYRHAAISTYSNDRVRRKLKSRTEPSHTFVTCCILSQFLLSSTSCEILEFVYTEKFYC